MKKHNKENTIFIRVDEDFKKNLRKEAGKCGLDLSSYCRMILKKDMDNT